MGVDEIRYPHIRIDISYSRQVCGSEWFNVLTYVNQNPTYPHIWVEFRNCSEKISERPVITWQKSNIVFERALSIYHNKGFGYW